MLKNKFLKIALLLPLVALALSGCSLSLNSDSGSSGISDGGIFKSTNKGGSWAQKVLILTVGAKKSFSGIDIISLAMDPSDNKAVYAGSLENGLFYSYDGGESWQIASNLGKLTVNNIAVDPADKCVIYATASNKVFKSEDCCRTWSQVYFDNDIKAAISSLAIDQKAGNNIFIGTSNGDVIKSSDKGASWRALDRFDSQIEKIIISPANSKIMFAGTAAKGVFRSVDGGAQWESLKDKLEYFDGSARFRDLVVVKPESERETILLATNYGLLKSTDNGNAWSKIELLTAEEEAKIYSIAVNADNANEIYYATGTAFYRSLDGGKNWTSKKLPANRSGFRLLIDSQDPAIVYLAVKQITK
ncbi:MAG: YCF48-related protein [bacterium]